MLSISASTSPFLTTEPAFVRIETSPWPGLKSVGWSEATTRPCTVTSRSRSPRATVARRIAVASTDASARVQRRMAGKSSAAMTISATAPAAAMARSFGLRPASTGRSIEEVSWIAFDASLAQPMCHSRRVCFQ